MSDISNADILTFDIEGNALYHGITKAHCMWVEDPITGVMEGFRPSEMVEGVELLFNTPIIVGHNIIDFDCPALTKLFGLEYKGFKYDTLVLSRLLDPDRKGGHSLKAWGKRLGILKGDFGEVEDDSIDVWEEFNEPMFKYCKQDVRVTTELLKHLNKQAGFPELCELRSTLCYRH